MTSQKSSQDLSRLFMVILFAGTIFFWILFDAPRNWDIRIGATLFLYHFLPLLILYFAYKKWRFQFIHRPIFFLASLILLPVIGVFLKIFIENALWKIVAFSFDYSLTIVIYEGGDYLKQYAYLYKNYLLFFMLYEFLIQTFSIKNGQEEILKPIINHLYIKVNKELVKVKTSDILFIEGLRDYVKINTSEEILVTKKTMKKMEQELPQDEFIRVQKSFIVNKNHIKKIRGNMVQIKDQNIPIGATYKENLVDHLPLDLL